MKYNLSKALLTACLLAGSFHLQAQYIELPIIKKDKEPVSPDRPKAPSNQFVTVYCFQSEGRLSFSFSDSIETLDVTVTNITTGETHVALITHAEVDMQLPLTSGCTYLITCLSDTGHEFETELPL